MKNASNKLNKESLNKIDEMCDCLAEVEKPNYHSKLESFEVYMERQRKNLIESFSDLNKTFDQAYHVVFSHLKDGFGSDRISRSEIENFLREIKAGQTNLSQALQSGKFKKDIEDHKTIQDILGYSSPTLTFIHEIGVDCIKKNDFISGCAIFTLLTCINSKYHNFWVCLAICLQSLHQWEDALLALQMAEATDQTDPVTYFYASECLEVLNEHQKAVDAVEKAIEHADKLDEEQCVQFKKMAFDWKENLLKTA